MHPYSHFFCIFVGEKEKRKREMTDLSMLSVHAKLASTRRGDWILDPFAGSSTTGIASSLLGRRFLGIEREEEFVRMSRARRDEIDRLSVADSYRKKIKDICNSSDSSEHLFNEEVSIDLPF